MEEIVYQWFPGQTEILVGNSEMAQFEYKGSNLSSKFELFSEGQLERNLIWESLNMLQDLISWLLQSLNRGFNALHRVWGT